MDKFTLSIVIPVYNEAPVLANSIKTVKAVVNSLTSHYEILIIDDGSLDDSFKIVKTLNQKDKRIKAIAFSRNFGKEAAIAAGLREATGEAVVIMDADLQHPPKLIPEMVKLWLEGYEVVDCIKVHRGQESLINRMLSKLFYLIMKALTGFPIMNASDFKLFSRKAVNAHNCIPEKTRFFRGITSWLGFRRITIPYSVQVRTAGEKHWTWRALIRLSINAITAFSTLPLHIVTFLGVATLIISVFLGIETLYMKLSGRAVSGFTTVILLLLFVGSVLMVSLGIIGEYLARIYEEVKHRPSYIIDKRTE